MFWCTYFVIKLEIPFENFSILFNLLGIFKLNSFRMDNFRSKIWKVMVRFIIHSISIFFIHFHRFLIIFRIFVHQRQGWLSATNREISIFQKVKNKEIKCSGFVVIGTIPDFGMQSKYRHHLRSKGNVSVIVLIFRHVEETYIMVWFVIVSPESFMVKSLVTLGTITCALRTLHVHSSSCFVQTIFAFIRIYIVTKWTFCAKIAIMTARNWLRARILCIFNMCRKTRRKNSNQITNDVVSICLFKRICCSFKYLFDPYSKSFLFYVHKRPMFGQIYEIFHEVFAIALDQWNEEKVVWFFFLAVVNGAAKIKNSRPHSNRKQI